jgi:nitrogen fixation protein FixH
VFQVFKRRKRDIHEQEKSNCGSNLVRGVDVLFGFFFTHIHTGKAMANVTVSPGHSGPVDISIQLETIDETPLSAKSVSITLSDPESGRKLPTVVASHSADDDWRAQASLAPGKWMLALNIAISDVDSVEVESPILIK